MKKVVPFNFYTNLHQKQVISCEAVDGEILVVDIRMDITLNLL